MRIFLVLFLSLFFTSSILNAHELNTSDFPSPKSFKEAYILFQKYEAGETYKEQHMKTMYAQKAYEFGKEKFGYKHQTTINLLLNWVYSFSDHKSDHYKLSQAFDKSLRILEKENKSDQIALVDPFITMAFIKMGIQSQLNDPQSRVFVYRNYYKGLSLIKKVNKIFKKTYGENSIQEARLNMSTGRKAHSYFHNYEMIRYETIKKHYSKARNIYKIHADEYAIDLAETNFWLAKLEYEVDRKTLALKSMGEAIETYDKIDPTNPLTLTAHALMGKILEAQGKRKEATFHFLAIGRANELKPEKPLYPIYIVQPVLPNGLTGTILLKFTVDKEGLAQDIETVEANVVRSYVKAATKALMDARFSPKFKDGSPVDTQNVTYRFVFERARN